MTSYLTCIHVNEQGLLAWIVYNIIKILNADISIYTDVHCSNKVLPPINIHLVMTGSFSIICQKSNDYVDGFGD